MEIMGPAGGGGKESEINDFMYLKLRSVQWWEEKRGRKIKKNLLLFILVP